MSTARKASLFRNGRNQAVRIPRDLEMPGDEVLVRKDGDRLIIEPVPKNALATFLATLEPIDEDFDFDDKSPARPVDL